VTATDLTRRRLLGAALGSAAVLALPGGSPVQRAVGACDVPRLGAARLPRAVVGGYWTYWSTPPRLGGLHPAYNLVYLFHADPNPAAAQGGSSLRWLGPRSTTFTAALADWRAAGGSVLLTVGGADAQVPLPDRSTTRRVLASIAELHTELGGFDGVDWNTYEGVPAPPTDELVWASAELKRVYGPRFAITTPPAARIPSDRAHCRGMLDAGVLDLVAPQCYDAPGPWDPTTVAATMRWWADGLGGSDRLAVGVGLPAAVASVATSSPLPAWDRVRAGLPGIRGSYAWDLSADADDGWAFAEQVGGAIRSGCAPA
jgi:hypothetical protein